MRSKVPLLLLVNASCLFLFLIPSTDATKNIRLEKRQNIEKVTNILNSAGIKRENIATVVSEIFSIPNLVKKDSDTSDKKAPTTTPITPTNPNAAAAVANVTNNAGDTNGAEAATNATTTATNTTTPQFGPKIDFMLSNTWNSSQYLARSNPNIQFVYNGPFNSGGQNSTNSQPTIVAIEVKERRQYQKMRGLGASISDATAIVLQGLRSTRPDAYDQILNLCFNESPEWIAKGGAGMNMIRIPIGASDFGFIEYTYDDTVDGTPDPSLLQFDINKSPKRWQTIQDILKINPNLVIMATPWSQPAWMKGNLRGSLRGGSVLQQYEPAFGDYLVKFVKTLKETKGINVNVLSLQNEPLYDKAIYPCTNMQPDQQARIGALTRKKLDVAGFQNVQLLTYDHNWDNTDYGVSVFDQAAEDFAGIAWHCYGGDPSGQEVFNEAYPDRWVWFTECTRITQYYEEPWENIKKQFSQIIKGSITYNSQTIILWNLALQVDQQGFTVPSLPQTCRNCLAPILIYDNSTGQLEGLNRSVIDMQKSKRDSFGTDLSYINMFNEYSRRDDSGSSGGLAALQQNTANLSDAKVINIGADNEGQVIPPVQDTNYRTSDYVTLAHLGVAIRPQSDGERWAQRVGVITSEDNHSGPILKAQLFRNSLGNGHSRWSVIILQQYDHYGYNMAKAEDIVVQLKFRDYVANFTIPPGAFTLQWTAEDTSFEHEGDKVKESSSRLTKKDM